MNGSQRELPSPDTQPGPWLQQLGACRAALVWAEPIPTLRECWHQCERPDYLLWFLDKLGRRDLSKERLFACRCVRETPLADGRKVWDLVEDPRSRAAVEVAERFARGEAADGELLKAHAAASDAAADADFAAASSAARAAAWVAVGAARVSAADNAARSAVGAARVSAADNAARSAVGAVVWAASGDAYRAAVRAVMKAAVGAAAWDAVEAAVWIMLRAEVCGTAMKHQAQLFREVYGDPWEKE